MTVYESPAKLNLSLIVGPPRPDGFHPLESLVQTVDWLDRLEVEEAEEDAVVITGAEIDPEDNLVTRAVRAMRSTLDFPPLAVTLDKSIPHGAGLGGGSSNAAAALLAVTRFARAAESVARDLAPSLGSDVPLFLIGGSLLMGGRGEQLETLPPLTGFAVAIVVPPFEMSTVEVYRRWDQLEGPVGEVIDTRRLPPPLRDGMPIRNDLTPAAVSLRPELADFMADLRSAWGSPVAMTGSGSACFSFFPDLDEATSASQSTPPSCRASVGVGLRDIGVAPQT